jgi:hypothetical protein
MRRYDVRFQIAAPRTVVCGTCGTCGARVEVDWDDRIDLAIDDTSINTEADLIDRMIGIAEMLIDEGEACEAPHAPQAVAAGAN